MKKTILAALLAATVFPLAANADEPGEHPAYLHALSNLRSAYWLIQHRGTNDPFANGDERRAMAEIRYAYQAIHRAAIDDGKDVDAQPPSDMTWDDHGGRLHKASDLLRDADNDVRREEDDWQTRGLQHRALVHIDAAWHATDAAIRELNF